MSLNSYAQRVLQDSVVAKYPWEKEFIQSVTEVFESLGPLLDRESKYEKNCILERIVEIIELAIVDPLFSGSMLCMKSHALAPF